MSTTFSGQILAEKLSKLNNSQQSIESLSNWCISYREKAKQVVETWDEMFKSSQRGRRISFLYLANDILQNSKKKGSEFVNEFWGVLPAALKQVLDGGDDHGKKAVSRLVDIWEERKVFGSRGRILEDERLVKDALPVLGNNVKSLDSIRIVKKDAESIRIKLAVGSAPEKIVSAFQSVNDEESNEESALNKCKAAMHRVEKMEKDISFASAQGNQPPSTLGDVQEQENVLRKCVEQLKSVEATRQSLLAQLKDAVKDQESKLEFLHTQLQFAQGQIDQACYLKQKLGSAPTPSPQASTLPGATITKETNPSPILPISNLNQPPPVSQPFTSLATPNTTEEENNKAAAAAIAAKLAASASSAQMLSAVFSSLVAEEAAKSNGLKSNSSMSLPIFPPEKRPKLEKPMPVSDVGSGNVHQQPFSNLLHNHHTNSQMHSPFSTTPPPLPGHPQPPSPYAQSTNMGAGPMPSIYGAKSGLPVSPPMPTHTFTGPVGPPGTPQFPQQQQQQQLQQQQHMQQLPASGGCYQPRGTVFYGQSHQQPATPPVPRP